MAELSMRLYRNCADKNTVSEEREASVQEKVPELLDYCNPVHLIMSDEIRVTIYF